jgi:hypothetical protein
LAGTTRLELATSAVTDEKRALQAKELRAKCNVLFAKSGTERQPSALKNVKTDT